MRLPLPLNLSIRNAQRLLRAHVKPGDHFLEIGGAPCHDFRISKIGGLVTEADRKYHIYECLDLFGVRFKLMCLNDAKKQGYTPCEKCSPPK